MPKDPPSPPPTLALSTKVEEDFVSPLTSLRGALEILRDFPDLSQDERDRFLETALRGCARLEQGVEELAKTVYAAGQSVQPHRASGLSPERYKEFADRVHIFDDIDTIEVDFSGFEFSSSKVVGDFYDVIEELIEASGRDWYLVVNYRDCSIWPEAWVAFAHRGKRVNVSHSLGTVRYSGSDDGDAGSPADSQSFSSDPDMYESRDAAFAKIEEMKLAKPA